MSLETHINIDILYNQKINNDSGILPGNQNVKLHDCPYDLFCSPKIILQCFIMIGDPKDFFSPCKFFHI